MGDIIIGDDDAVSRMIPVVDLGEPDEQKLIRSISEASREWGFFQAVNHGVSTEVISRLQSAGTHFFNLPSNEKEAYANPHNPRASMEGYGKKLMNKAWGEYLFNKIWPPSEIDYKMWPKKPTWYREANEEYGRQVRDESGVIEKVFKCLSMGLGLEGHVLKECVGGENIIHLMKINYYPAINKMGIKNEDDETVKIIMGVPAHTDMSILTILVPNQVPGLQLLKDDRWIDVHYIPNALVFHIGDQIQIASNGYYKSVMHRSIVDKEKTRMSWPLFLEPPSDFVVGPIPQLLLKNKTTPKFCSMTFKDYAISKLNIKQTSSNQDN